MAREFGKHQFGMWSDDDFLNRPRFDKMLYGVLIDQPSFNQAGVAPLNLRRLAKAMRDTDIEPSEDELLAAFARLEADRYVFLDLDTGEVLLRTMMRSDGVDSKPTVLVGALRKALQTESAKLRAVLRDEVARIELPDVKGDGPQAKRLREQLPEMVSQIMTKLPEWTEEMGRIDYAPPTPSRPSARPSQEGHVGPLPDPHREGRKSPGRPDPLADPQRDPLVDPRFAVAVAVESPTAVVEKEPQKPKTAPKGAAKPKTIEQQVADSVYERLGKAVNFMGLRGVVKWAIHERGSDPQRVEAACVAVHGLGKPITRQVIDQCLDGKFGPIRVGDGPAVEGRDFIDYPGVVRDASGQLPKGFCER
ncbi:hypothetical protein EF294_07410 [Gordonia oryzae]|uniref:Uncharacterized protein n=1 Tax=Gordonia oryzae TaxID=2487349 RepID=A0A3N4GPY6_9ACTN|nr:hypothetical protein [Gordonia oryzae]RPA64902.1 hypothetical protein EF294_07410 [Gordonia oryzae]